MRGYAYSAQTGDVRYSLPAGGWWGAVYARGADPGGTRLPSQVLLRGGRVYSLYPASAYGIANATLATEEPVTSHGGASESAYCYFVGAAFRAYEALSNVDVGAPPTTLAVGAPVWGWSLVA
jgi:hypothetical protein